MELEYLKNEFLKRAEKKVDKEYKEFINLLSTNEFGSRLMIKDSVGATVFLCPQVYSRSYLPYYTKRESNKLALIDRTNLKELREKLINEYMMVEQERFLEAADKIMEEQ